jgi:hypothetical protein
MLHLKSSHTIIKRAAAAIRLYAIDFMKPAGKDCKVRPVGGDGGIDVYRIKAGLMY